MTIELKPCPFCGGRAYISEHEGSPITVICRGCGCQMMGHKHHFSSRESAVSTWNTRAAIEVPVQKPMIWAQRHKYGPLCFCTADAQGGDDWSTPFPLYTTPQPDETAALRAKLAEVERERDDAIKGMTLIGAEALSLRADRDEERKLADDAVHELKHARAVLRHEQYLDDPGREAVLAAHAARRKEQQG